jgi:autotransporter-associated beta strand protein
MSFGNRKSVSTRQCSYLRAGVLHLTLLIAAALVAPDAAFASTYRWHVDADGAWNDPANWAVIEGPFGPGYPSAPGDEVELLPKFNGVRTITIPDGVTIRIGELRFDTSSGSERIEIVRVGTGLLVMDNVGEDAVLESTGNGFAALPSGLRLDANLVVNALVTFGAISESGGARNVTITGGRVTYGPDANTYSGTTTVAGGWLDMTLADAIRVPGPLVVGNGADNPFAVSVTIRGDSIAHGADVLVHRGALALYRGLNLSAELQVRDLTVREGTVTLGGSGTRLTIANLAMEGGRLANSSTDSQYVLLGGLTATSTAANTVFNIASIGQLTLASTARDFVVADGPQATDLFAFNISGTTGRGVRKLGPGLAVFPSDNTYTGPTEILGGTLRINGKHPSSAVYVDTLCTLSGEGTVGSITTASNSTVTPAEQAIGSMYSGSVAFAGGSHFLVDIDGVPGPKGPSYSPGPSGPGYDQLLVTGTVALGNASLHVTSVLVLPPDGRFTIIDNDGGDPVIGTFAGLAEGATFQVESGARFSVSYQGGDGNDVVLSNITPVTYFLSEGATGAFFDEDLLIANPNAVPAPVTLTFFLPGGGSLVQQRTVPARSRMTIPVDQIPGLGETSPSVEVRSDNRLTLAVERTMFWDASHYGGHTASAVPQPERQWFFAEGAQGFFHTFLLLANPNPSAVTATVTFLRENDSPVVDTIPLPPHSRVTVSAGDYAALADRSFGMTVETPLPITAERAMYFASTETRLWTGGHGNAGISAPSTSWFHAEGASGTFFTTFILLSNPTDTATVATLWFLRPDGATTFAVTKTVPPRQRVTVNPAAEQWPALRNASFATKVESGVPIVSERVMYWPGDDTPFGEGHASSGIPRAALNWVLAEGRVGGPNAYMTYVLIANPDINYTANVTVTFLRESGAPVVKTYAVPRDSRFNIDVSTMVPELSNESFGVLVESANTPIAVERSMYWNVEGRFWAGGTNAVGTVVLR